MVGGGNVAIVTFEFEVINQVGGENQIPAAGRFLNNYFKNYKNHSQEITAKNTWTERFESPLVSLSTPRADAELVLTS